MRQPTPLVTEPVGPPLALGLRCPSIQLPNRPMAAIQRAPQAPGAGFEVDLLPPSPPTHVPALDSLFRGEGG